MEKQKLDLIEEIINIKNEDYINALYEIVLYSDWDYMEDLFSTKEEFEDFIEKWTPNKCSEGEE